MAGISDNSIIWVAGEAGGLDEHGVASALPTDSDTADSAAAAAYTNLLVASGILSAVTTAGTAATTALGVLNTRLVASGVLPV